MMSRRPRTATPKCRGGATRSSRTARAGVLLVTAVVVVGPAPLRADTTAADDGPASVCESCASSTSTPALPDRAGVRAGATGSDALSGARSRTITRDRYKWPFASTSIWNTPLGSDAVYTPLRLSPPTTAYGVDEVYLSFTPRAPLRSLVDRGYWWPWINGLLVSGRDTGVSVRVPDSWVMSPPARSDTPNRASAALEADGSTAREWQYSVRPAPGTDISMFGAPRARYSLTGDGLQGRQFGAHGGSAMTAIGGTIRVGELTGLAPIRHALAVTMNMRKWGTQQGGRITNGSRWPATAADAYWKGARGYGTVSGTGGVSKPGLGMGSLLAIPPNVDLSTLKFETAAGAKLAWTHQNYGAYVVDDSYDKGAWDVHRLNVEARAVKQFPALDTYPGTNTPFGRDMNKIFVRLALVDNNGPTSIGGGGTPRQPPAPPFR